MLVVSCTCYLIFKFHLNIMFFFALLKATGEPLIQRKDDTAEVLKSRLEAFHKQTEPVWLLLSILFNFWWSYFNCAWFILVGYSFHDSQCMIEGLMTFTIFMRNYLYLLQGLVRVKISSASVLMLSSLVVMPWSGSGSWYVPIEIFFGLLKSLKDSFPSRTVVSYHNNQITLRHKCWIINNLE